MKQRELWIDVCKSFLIYFMVLGHCGFVKYNIWFYTFHMPCFFLISGFLYKSHPVKKTIKRLFIPVLFFSIINFLFMIFTGIIYDNLDILYLLKNGLNSFFVSGSNVSLFPGVWFIFVLFFSRCLMGDLSFIKKDNKNMDLFLMIICILVTFLLPKISSLYDSMQNIYIIKTISCLPFMLFGRYLQQYKNLLNLSVPIIISIIFVSIILTINNGSIDIYSSVYGKNTIIMYINAIIASLAFCGICHYVTNCKTFFEYISKGTILILGLHIIILQVLKVLLYKIGVEYTIFWGIISAIIVILICYPIIRVVDKRFPWIIGK